MTVDVGANDAAKTTRAPTPEAPKTVTRTDEPAEAARVTTDNATSRYSSRSAGDSVETLPSMTTSSSLFWFGGIATTAAPPQASIALPWPAAPALAAVP